MPPIDAPVSDTSRGVQHNPDQDWPESVKLQICWRDSAGRASVSTQIISSNQFFGRGEFGAPLSGEHLIQYIERMRKAGPPKIVRRGVRRQP